MNSATRRRSTPATSELFKMNLLRPGNFFAANFRCNAMLQNEGIPYIREDLHRVCLQNDSRPEPRRRIVKHPLVRLTDLHRNELSDDSLAVRTPFDVFGALGFPSQCVDPCPSVISVVKSD